MSRGIKVRAWVKSETGEGYFMSHPRWIDLEGGRICTESGLQPSEFQLMQFTGMTDKNRKAIYDGDIVKDLENGQIFEVFWNDLMNGCWWFATRGKDGSRCHARRIDLDALVVIGNIHDNPELLEV